MCVKSALLDASTPKLQEHGNELQEFIRSTVDEMVSRRVEELRKLGVDANRPEVRQYVQKSRESKLEYFEKAAIESIEDKIAFIKARSK